MQGGSHIVKAEQKELTSATQQVCPFPTIDLFPNGISSSPLRRCNRCTLPLGGEVVRNAAAARRYLDRKLDEGLTPV